MSEDLVRRARIIQSTRDFRAEIEQIFIDCAYWNDNVRRPHEDPIDPDPGGTMRRLADRLDAVLAADKGHGPLMPILDRSPRGVQ